MAIPVAAAVAGCGAASASDPGSSGKSGKNGGAQHGSSSHGGSKQRSGGPGAAVTTLAIGRATSAPPVPSGFVGISTIFSDVHQEVGYDPSTPDPVFVQLLKNLAPTGHPVIRLGGDSTDWTWWPVPHMAKPAGVRFSLDSSWMAVMKALVHATDAKLIVGINFEADSRRLAAAEAKAIVHGLGSSSIQALELGNEPELYTAFPWYQTKRGAKIFGRSRGEWDQSSYYPDYANIASGLPNVPLAGPSVGGPLWIAALPQFLSHEPRVKLATIHAYPLKVCSKTAHVTISELLDPKSSAGLANMLRPAVTAAHRRHVPLRLDEMNAVSCGGEKGVSDTFASALWSVDFLFQLARIGVAGINVNSVPGSINSPFEFTTAGNHWSGIVHPLYYGMQLFAQAAPDGAHLLSVSGHRDSTLRTWATRAPDGTIHVVVINDKLATPANVALSVPAGGGRPATVALLRAPRINSTSNVTLGGQSYGSLTTTGTLGGTLTAGHTTPNRGRYSVRVPPATVAMLTIEPH